jgi:hypothetical protein
MWLADAFEFCSFACYIVPRGCRQRGYITLFTYVTTTTKVRRLLVNLTPDDGHTLVFGLLC